MKLIINYILYDYIRKHNKGNEKKIMLLVYLYNIDNR